MCERGRHGTRFWLLELTGATHCRCFIPAQALGAEERALGKVVQTILNGLLMRFKEVFGGC